MSKDNTESSKVKSEKKKPEPVATSDTIYKQTVDHEESEAVVRNGEDDLNMYMELCSKLRSHILKLKADTNEAPPVLDQLKREASLSFVMLKKLNRLEKYRLKNARDTLQAKKSKVDSFNLQLQNLRYEIYHLKKEVVKCLQFKSKDEDIDLVDEESFFKDAPEEIARPEITKSDPHQLKLSRLEWELKQRKELADQCNQVERENESVAGNINKKRGQLDNLAPLLKQLLSVSKPLIENLSYPENHSGRAQYKLTHLLPEPLYCLFVQTDAYRLAFCPNIEVKIKGKEDDAEQVNKMLNEAKTSVDSDSDTEEAAGNTRESGTSSSKHRHHHHHHSKSSLPSQVALKPSDSTEEKRNKLCLTHPLSVELVIQSKGTNVASMTLTFSYLYNLHVVAVKVSKTGIASSESAGSNHLDAELLAELFPEDSRKEEGEAVSPNLMNHYQLKQVGLTWDSAKLGHPYPWAQRMAGLTFPLATTQTPSVSVSQTSVPRVVKRLVKRFKSAIELSRLLVQLEKCQLLGSHQCILTAWQSLTWSQYQSQLTMGLISPTSSHSLTWSQLGLSTQSPSPVYKAVLTRGSAKCTAYVVLHYDYPAIAPVLNIQIELNKVIRHPANDDGVRDMQKEVNFHWQDLISDNTQSQSPLRSQLECLASCFDIYLECYSCFDIYLECLGVKEFPRKKSFIKTVRGRTRAYPYKCSSVGKSDALYTQR
uniref:THO complex subunit 5 homolog n=2 Tax=Cacopsylla melanoneura TaxID=428564 RepID=A0A8D9DV57_9HEMI